MHFHSWLKKERRKAVRHMAIGAVPSIAVIVVA